MSFLAPHLQASGNIRPSRFVKVSGNFTGAEAGAGEKICGVSMEGTNTAPIPGITSQYAAESGQPLQLHGQGAICLLTLGTGGCTANDYLKADSAGAGVVASSGDESGALALQAGSAAEKVLVQVLIRKA